MNRIGLALIHKVDATLTIDAERSPNHDCHFEVIIKDDPHHFGQAYFPGHFLGQDRKFTCRGTFEHAEWVHLIDKKVKIVLEHTDEATGHLSLKFFVDDGLVGVFHATEHEKGAEFKSSVDEFFWFEKRTL